MSEFDTFHERNEQFNALCQQAVEQAGNQEYLDRLATTVHEQHIGVWNLAAGYLLERGRRVLVRDSVPGTDYTSSTGLLELSGMTPDLPLDPEKGIDVARVSCWATDRKGRTTDPIPVDGVLGRRMITQSLIINRMTVVPIGTEGYHSYPYVAETYGESRTPARRLAKMPVSLAAVNIKLEPFTVVERPYQPPALKGLTTGEAVEAAVKKVQKQMAPIVGLYGLIGAFGRPLHERPEFQKSYQAPPASQKPSRF